MSDSKKSNSWGGSRYVWLGLFAAVIALGVLYSLVQPLGVSPDEAAHMKYVKFLASHGRLPVWQLQDGGEAGYESQHPPLYYALGAAVYRAASGLPENWRWQAVRWYTLLIGIVLLWVARGFFLDYFRNRPAAVVFAFAAAGTTPLLLEYMSYINPDIMSVMWCSVILWMCLRVARGEAVVRDRVVLALALGFGMLTKMTVLGTVPMILLAHTVEPHSGCDRVWERRRLAFLGTMLGAVVPAAWWYARNSLMYRTPFVHTLGRFGSGLELAGMTGIGAHLLRLTLSNTYITTWVERAWMPPGVAGSVFYMVVTAGVVAAIVAAIARAARRGPRTTSAVTDRAPLICVAFLVSLIVFHQAQVWLVDYEFNAGGRYMLNCILGIHAMVIGSLLYLRGGKALIAAWTATLVGMNAVSIWYMLAHVNISVVPSWHWLELTVPYK